MDTNPSSTNSYGSDTSKVEQIKSQVNTLSNPNAAIAIGRAALKKAKEHGATVAQFGPLLTEFGRADMPNTTTSGR